MILTPLFILLLLITFILVWLFVKTIDDRKWLTFLVSIVLTPMVYFYLFYPLLNIFSSYHHEKYFDAEAWKSKPIFRYEMSENMLKENFFLGKTKTEVTDILGKSEWYGWDDQKKSNSDNQWNYNLGVKPGAFNDQQECLELIFQNEIVVKAYQYQLTLTKK